MLHNARLALTMMAQEHLPTIATCTVTCACCAIQKFSVLYQGHHDWQAALAVSLGGVGFTKSKKRWEVECLPQLTKWKKNMIQGHPEKSWDISYKQPSKMTGGQLTS